MPKLYQRKSLLTLLLCIAFANCGSSAKKNAEGAPAETTVSLADTAKSRAMKNVTPPETTEGDNLPDITEPPAPITPTDNSTTDAAKPIVRTLTPYEQSNTAPVYLPASSSSKTTESAEVKAKREAEETKKKADAAAIVQKYHDAKKKAEEDKIKAEEEAAKKKAEQEAADKKALEEETARRKKIQDEMDKLKKEFDEEQKKLDAAKKLLESTITPTDSSSTITPPVVPVDSIPNAATFEPGSLTLPNDSTVVKTDSLADLSVLPPLDTAKVEITAKDTTDKTILSPEAIPTVDMGGKTMTDVLEDLSEALLTTSPGSPAESENVSKIFAEFNNITANFDSMDHRLENIFLMAKKNERFAKALQEKSPFANSTTNESKILGPLWYAFQVQAKAAGQQPDKKLITVYDNGQGKSTIMIATAYFPQDRWEEKSSRTDDAKKQLQQFRQVWNALVASGYNLTHGYPTIVGLSNKENDGMTQPCKLVRSFLIEEDKKAGITNSNFSLFGEETITTGNYWTSKKQRRVEIRIAETSSISVNH